ncbi:putative YigZ family protein [Mycoplasmopsis mustelae]|uniref:Putative YigZ family protein n=1 Tax=Mycoplasmopsis mustelae TaxID=171289 RepID=A0A4R7UCW5_9BACT|nr:YigZ family protein [Mycoplasmopsis mustelae]TDV24302.1 putative YigZ family protein [Mycoplasmopsis mustelae]
MTKQKDIPIIQTESVVKRSKFIGYCMEVHEKSCVSNFIKNIVKGDHKDATHITYAYVINENGAETAAFSDGGEPKNTAGKRIFELIQLKNLKNILVVVVRYFGGQKLGASGLIRAYRKLASDAINMYMNRKGTKND